MSDDHIKKSDAIDVLEKLSACKETGEEIGTEEETYIGKYEAITEISDLPSADRPKGEWIESHYVDEEWISHRADFYKCSICGKRVNLFQMRNYRFCPNCGCRMKGADDE